MKLRLWVLLTAVLAAAVLVRPATAQVEDQLSAYTGANVEGYLQPLANAFGASLNSGYFHSARIPKAGLKISLETRVMGVLFSDDDRTFKATTEGGFSPQTTTDAPTIVGSTSGETVSGDGGTAFSFPGGLDLNSFGIVVPQLRVGGVAGTEALVRYIAFEAGDSEIGDVSLFGFGARHSVSQYFEGLPLDLAAGFLWQTFSLGKNNRGDDLLAANAFTFGVQGSKQLGVFEPYAGLSFDSFSLDVDYDSDVTGAAETIELDGDSSFHLTIGGALNFLIGNIQVEYNIAEQNNFAFGLTLGNVGI